MKYKIFFNNEKLVNKDFSKIPEKQLNLIMQKIELLGINGIGNSQIKKLNNYDLCDYRLRVGDFRILFNMDILKKEIIIFRILHRSKLY